jgi:hypothetical protein
MANCKINPVLYNVFLQLKDTLDARMVHRRCRTSSNCIEIIFLCDLAQFLNGRINTLKEAEKCGFWVICRAQNKRGHKEWRHYPVFQLFLTPVHPKKRQENQLLAAQNANTLPHSSHTQEVTFEPIFEQKTHKHLHMSKKSSTFAPDLEFFPFQGNSVRTDLTACNLVKTMLKTCATS